MNSVTPRPVGILTHRCLCLKSWFIGLLFSGMSRRIIFLVNGRVSYKLRQLRKYFEEHEEQRIKELEELTRNELVRMEELKREQRKQRKKGKKKSVLTLVDY
jgi:hypothetical protein